MTERRYRVEICETRRTVLCFTAVSPEEAAYLAGLHHEERRVIGAKTELQIRELSESEWAAEAYS
jgi:hypothetical protein